MAQSVIEIDVNDAKFKAFLESFNAFRERTKNLEKSFSQLNPHIDKTTKSQKDFNKSIKDGNQSLKESENITKRISASAASIAASFASSVFSLSKWGSLLSLGGFGALSKLASDDRRMAQGLGISTGQLKGANVTLGRYINTESVLGNIADIKSDLSRRSILGRLGGGVGENPAQMLPDILRRTVQDFKAHGETRQYAEARGLTQIFSMDELRRLAGLNAKELSATLKDFERARKSLEAGDQTNKAWQDLWYKLKESGSLLETSLIKSLVKLAPVFERFIGTVSEKISSFLSSDAFKKVIDKFADFINGIDDQKIQGFFDAIGKISDALVSVSEFVLKWFGAPKEKTKGSENTLFGSNNPMDELNAQLNLQFSKFTGKFEKEAGNKVNATTIQNAKPIIQGLMKIGVPYESAVGAVGGLVQESGLNPKAKNLYKGNEYLGIGQWGPDRQALFEKLYHKQLKGSSLDDQIKFMLYEYKHTEKKALDIMKSQASVASGVRGNLAYERPALEGTSLYELEKQRRTAIGERLQVMLQEPKKQEAPQRMVEKSSTQERRELSNQSVNVNMFVSTQPGADVQATANALSGGWYGR